MSEGAGSEEDCEKMCQPLAAGLADSPEAPNLSEPLKPEYIYSTTPRGETGMLKEREVKLGHQFRGLVCSVGTSTKRQQRGRQHQHDSPTHKGKPSSMYQ